MGGERGALEVVAITARFSQGQKGWLCYVCSTKCAVRMFSQPPRNPQCGGEILNAAVKSSMRR
eukprot:254481-Prorocentrum_minimum.AAC.2